MVTADISSSIEIYEQDTGASKVANSPFEYKEILVECPSTADDGDTFNVTLATYGITSVKSIKGFDHTTPYSVVVVQAPTTVVATGVLTVTIGGSTDNLVRTFLIGGY